ncbi:uncharacterized protein ASPGLDRAFT_43637 [Aspergillus glaucus CBS 516.65]|uniref:Uncharacterized protein n=1 Tax=Aspergillus glaucus CBS 516.65 TaxID=1160497 RepID=A0A1L9VTB3_ASPGL|nr:hypothetical protein ASPGLDRAFT_43637 [Aspergillus glaucus CBS 516.65]OJJ87145.1 hypothetical protein ASPGLDRAFT_43637 [Aspergillus glaucus CBS 516.65]
MLENHLQPDPPRTPDRTVSDTTSPHLDQAHWSIDNLPSVLYALRPGTQYIKSRARVRETPHKIFNKHVRDFSILPSRISSKVEGWRLEAWFRIDRRIEAQDILDRVDPRFRGEVSSLEIELRREEFRRLFHVADWKSQVSINEVARVVHRKGVDLGLNTTRGVTPGLVNPEKGDEGGRIPVPAEKKREKTGGVASWPFFVMQGVRKQSMKSEACFWPSGSKGYPLDMGARTANGSSGEVQRPQGLSEQPRSISSVPPVRKAWVEDRQTNISEETKATQDSTCIGIISRDARAGKS